MVFDKRPCFFKLFFSDSMAQAMGIPPQFVKDNLKKVTASRGILKSDSRGQWPVEVRKYGEEVFLMDGWQKFVRDNLIQELDFLLFKYDGDMCFTVDIFDNKHAGIRPPADANFGSSSGLKSGNRQPEDPTLGSRSVLKKGIKQKYAILNTSGGLKSGKYHPEDVTLGSGSGLKKGSEQKDVTLGTIGGLKSGKRQPVDATLGSGSGLKKGNKQKDAVLGSSGGLKSGPCQLQNATHGSGSGLKKGSKQEDATLIRDSRRGKRTVAGVDGEAINFSSQLPFFKMLIKDYNVRLHSFMVNLPRSFTSIHFLKDEKKVILRSVEGKAWEVICREYNGKHSFGIGWRRFADDNQLKVGDVCIFELVGEMELLVHIFKK